MWWRHRKRLFCAQVSIVIASTCLSWGVLIKIIGSLKTPQLLELSGIGKASLLRSLGVPVILDLPQVGENLMDHPVSISDFKVKDGVETLGADAMSNSSLRF